MALKNMIKVGDKVTFGRAGEMKRQGKVVKMNPKTAHIKCSNGDVMGASYGFIQKASSGKKKSSANPKRKAAKKNPVKRRAAKKKARRTTKKNPSRRTTARPPGVSLSPTPGYAGWLEEQNKSSLKKLDKALGVIVSGRGTPAVSDAKRKHVAVKKELRKRK